MIDGKVVLITGASSGIGAATARLLVAAGARVVVGARRIERIQSLADELGRDVLLPVVADVTQPDDVRALIDSARTTFGGLDAVFGNAGLGGGGTILDGDPERWKDILLTNVYGLALTVHYALEPLLKAEDGQVILASSIAGRKVSPVNHMYSASKWGVEAIGEGLREQFAGRIRVSLVSPGMVETELDTWSSEVLHADDVARAVGFCLEQPATVAINYVSLRHKDQEF